MPSLELQPIDPKIPAQCHYLPWIHLPHITTYQLADWSYTLSLWTMSTGANCQASSSEVPAGGTVDTALGPELQSQSAHDFLMTSTAPVIPVQHILLPQFWKLLNLGSQSPGACLHSSLPALYMEAY